MPCSTPGLRPLLAFVVTLFGTALAWGQGTGAPLSGQTSPGQEQSSADQGALGVLSLVAPQLDRFPVRGTLPVPRGTLVPGIDNEGFSLRTRDGAIWSAQAEVVSRYPNPGWGADVIELIAFVKRPDGIQPGQELRLEVVRGNGATGEHSRFPSVRDVLRAPESVVLRTRDVFDNQYRADLLTDFRERDTDLRLLRSGPVAFQVRTHENLVPRQPQGGASATLPHLMGIHSYITTWKDMELICIDLRVHNGHEGRDPQDVQDDPMGKVYFDGLELEIPTGWHVYQSYPTPSMGGERPEGGHRVSELLSPLADGKLHMMHPQSQFHRRLVLYRAGSKELARLLVQEGNLAYCQGGTNSDDQEYWSWWNPSSARYWSQNMPLPDLSYLQTKTQAQAELKGDFNELHSALTHGVPGPWPVVSPMLGWAHPYGYTTGGAVGGAGIHFFDGVRTAWAASTHGYRLFQMTHRMYTERHATTLYQLNGDAYHMEDWLEQGSAGVFLPTWIWLVPWLTLGDPYGFGSAPTFQVEAVIARGLQPDYEADLLLHNYIDTHHLIRYTRSAKVLAWLGNDAIAKDDLIMQGELCRATYCEFPQTSDGQMISTGMLADRNFVDQQPGDGFWIDRGEGWVIDTATTAYALASQDWRSRAHHWFDTIVDIVRRGQSDCSGTIMSSPTLNHLGGQYRVVQSISECILENALWGMRTTVYDGEDEQRVTDLNRVLRSSAYAMISDPVWDNSTSAAHFYTALGPYDQSLPSFCGNVPADGFDGTDGWQIWNMFVFGFELTGDVRFLQRATDLAGGTLTPESIGMDQHPGELETRAGMISFLQTVLGF
ncbi:MAG: hypothetical protein ACI9F9_000296 [Candidatus Paceibacteria bacterium]|jgi:hypothetical protein